MHPLMTARQQGVRVPEAQMTGQAPAMTITRAVRLELAMVEWSDERGMLHQSAAILAGDKVFVNEQWTAAFRSMVEAMSKQVFDRLESQDASKSPAVPKEDTVDIAGQSSEVISSSVGIDVFDTPKIKGK